MKKLIFIASLSIAFSTIMLISCRNNTTENSSTEEKPHKHTYQCSMKCEGDKTYDTEGTCPICSMALLELVDR